MLKFYKFRYFLTLLCKLLIILVLISPFFSNAHHSRAEFVLTDDPIIIEGIITEIFWTNPHAEFEISVTNTDGNEDLWTIESWAGPFALTPLGITTDMFAIGHNIKFLGWPSTYRENFFGATNALLEDGLEVILNVRGRSYLSNNFIGGQSALDRNISSNSPKNALAENLGIFRSWNNSGRAYENRERTYTDYAKEAQKNFDPIGNPVISCQQPSFPLVMNAPLGIEFELINDDTIRQTFAYFNTTRHILLNTSNEVEPELSFFGHSIGRWEGNTLHVETTNIDYPLSAVNGTPLGIDARIVETYTINQAQDTIEYIRTLYDPLSFIGPSIYSKRFTAINGDMQPWSCNLSSRPPT